VKNRASISKRILTLLVAMMYLATSSTALAHGLSHAQRALDVGCSMSESGKGSHSSIVAPAIDVSSTSDCFFCHHGPAVALTVVPGAAPAPSMALGTVAAVSPAQAISAFRPALPSLRAPPALS
jgi:hypothetical protein